MSVYEDVSIIWCTCHCGMNVCSHSCYRSRHFFCVCRTTCICRCGRICSHGLLTVCCFPCLSRRALSRLIDIESRQLSSASSVHQCDSLPLSRRQRELCSSPRSGEGAALMTVAARASLAGVRECQRQFADNRWRCQHFESGPLFGRSIKHRGEWPRPVYCMTLCFSCESWHDLA